MKFFINIVRDMYFDYCVPNQGGGDATGAASDAKPMPNTLEHPAVKKTLEKLDKARAELIARGKHISQRERLGYRYASQSARPVSVRDIMR